MRVKFPKGSEEWLMFVEYWEICQDFWQVDDTEEYWDGLMKKVNAFYEKYKGIHLAEKMAMALIESQEIKAREIREKNNLY